MKCILFYTSFVLVFSSCTNKKKDIEALERKTQTINKRTKMKGDFVFEEKTIKDDSLNSVKFSNKKVKSEDRKTGKKFLKDINSENNDTSLNSKIIQKQKPVEIPEKWSKAYTSDPKWMELYEETSNVFLSSWQNEFQNNPSARISKEELLFAYRRRMEKIFFETPSFIEFSVSELSKSGKFKEFISDFQTNIP